MSERERLARLAAISALKSDISLAELSKAARARERSLAQLAALDRENKATDLPPLAEEQVRVAYRRWADQRRAELNILLARQTAEWLARRDAAAQSFGKAQVVAQMTGRNRPPVR